MIRWLFRFSTKPVTAVGPTRGISYRDTSHPKGRSFVPTLKLNQLEDRAMLSSFGGGNFDFSRPFVTNPALPASSINFTSNTYHQIETSINGIAANIAKNAANTSAVLGQLGRVTARVPFGSNLQAILAADLHSLQQGATISLADATTVLNDAFQQVLGRDADPNAIIYGVPAIQGGTTVKQLVTLLATSPEFLANNTTDTSSISATQEQYVTALYEDILGRSPEASGLAYWEGQLASGANPSAVATAFVNSYEASISPTSILVTIPNATPATPSYYFGSPNADGSLPGPFRGTSKQAKIADLIFADLNAYLDQGEGANFNVLKSRVNYGTDAYLTFNGKVS
jgi:hypothetical protein